MLTRFRIRQRRITFKRGDYIEHHNGQIARLDNILVHELHQGERYIFLMITIVRKDTGEFNYILNLPRLQLSEETTVIGLRGVHAKRLWLVEHDKGLTHVTWDIIQL